MRNSNCSAAEWYAKKDQNGDYCLHINNGWNDNGRAVKGSGNHRHYDAQCYTRKRFLNCDKKSDCNVWKSDEFPEFCCSRMQVVSAPSNMKFGDFEFNWREAIGGPGPKVGAYTQVCKAKK